MALIGIISVAYIIQALRKYDAILGGRIRVNLKIFIRRGWDE